MTAVEYRDAAQNVLYSLGCANDTAGMITSKVIRTATFTNENGYAYDSLGRLVSHRSVTTNLQSAASSLQSLSYDLAGNRTQMVVNGSTANYTLGAGDRLASWTGGGLCEYDAAGCVTNLVYPDGRYVWLKWDGQYRLTAAYTNGVLAERYGYDALGRRAWIGTATATNHLIYDGPHVVAEVDATGRVSRSYSFGPGIDDVLSMTVFDGEATNTYCYIKDHQNTVLALVDAAGAVVESYDYDAWGNARVFNAAGTQTPTSAIGNRFTFQGREMSWATRLINFRARWYDSETGRWLSNDPIGISGGLNQYASCGNNPVSFVDPFGLFVNVENSIVNPQSPCAWEVGTKYSVDAATVGLTFGIYAVIAASVYGGAVAAPHAGRFLTQGHTFRTLRFFRMRHGPWGNSYELMRWKNILRLEAHPTARWMPRWMFRPHGHIDFLGEAIRKLHIPIIEPILAYFGYKAITSDETGSSVEKSVK